MGLKWTLLALQPTSCTIRKHRNWWPNPNRVRSHSISHRFGSSYDHLLHHLRPETKIFSCNKRKWNQQAFHLGKDQIEMAHEYRCLGIDFYSRGYNEASSKRQWIEGTEALMATPRREAIVGVTCWELESHLSEALVLSNFHIRHSNLGRQLEKSLTIRFLRRTWRYIYDVSCQSAVFNNLPYFP